MNNYIQYHNKTIKSSTKYSPNEIRDVDSPEIIEIISNNIIKSMKYHIIDNNEKLEKDDTLLLLDNIINKSGKYTKKNKIGNYIYPALFVLYINSNNIKIKVKTNINGIVKKDEIIKTDSNCCVLIPHFCYDYFLNKLSDLNNFESCKILAECITSDNDKLDNSIVDLNIDVNSKNIEDYGNDGLENGKFDIYESKKITKEKKLKKK